MSDGSHTAWKPWPDPAEGPPPAPAFARTATRPTDSMFGSSARTRCGSTTTETRARSSRCQHPTGLRGPYVVQKAGLDPTSTSRSWVRSASLSVWRWPRAMRARVERPRSNGTRESCGNVSQFRQTERGRRRPDPPRPTRGSGGRGDRGDGTRRRGRAEGLPRAAADRERHRAQGTERSLNLEYAESPGRPIVQGTSRVP
jgi:hypothetical protein